MSPLMSALPVFLGFLTSLLGALALVPLVRRLALRVGWVDSPDGGRKAHAAPIPNVGGLAIVGGVLIGLGTAAALGALGLAALDGALPSPRWLIGGLLIAAVGFVDDRVDLSHWTRLAAQLGVSALAFSDGARITLFDGALGGGTLALAVSFALTAVWMVGMMNAVNMIDGLDGLAGGAVAIAFAGLTAVHIVSGSAPSLILGAAVVGAVAGFLRYNAAPASVFMGDSGSLFLGFALASFGLSGTAHVNPVLNLVIPAVVMGLPVLDTLTSILRRVLTRRAPFAPDKDHIHHRLAERMTPSAAVHTLWGLSLFLALGGLAMASLPAWASALVFMVGTGVVYDLLWRIDYLPSPSTLAVRVRTRFLGGGRTERGHTISTPSAPDLPPRAGRFSDERFRPVSRPER